MPNDDPRLILELTERAVPGRQHTSVPFEHGAHSLPLRLRGPGLHPPTLWFAIRTHPFLILIWTLAICIGSAVMAVAIKDRYSAVALILLERDQTVNSTSVGSANADSEVEIMKSDGMAARVAQRLHLASDPKFAAAGATNWSHFLHQQIQPLLNLYETAPPRANNVANTDRTLRLSEPMSRAIRSLQKTVTIRRRGLTDVIGIEATSDDAREAALIANTYAEEYLREQVGAKIANLDQAESVLSGLVKKYNQVLAESEAQIAVRDRYKETLSALTSIAQQRSLVRPNARIASPALAPGLPSFPPRAEIVLLGLVAGIAAGGLAAYLKTVSKYRDGEREEGLQ